MTKDDDPELYDKLDEDLYGKLTELMGIDDDLSLSKEIIRLLDELDRKSRQDHSSAAAGAEAVDVHIKKTRKRLNTDALSSLEESGFIIDNSGITCPHCGKKISEIS